MAPKNQTQNQTQTQTPQTPQVRAPQGGAAEQLPRGRDWAVTKREFNGRAYYNLVVKPGIRGTIQILEEALPKVHEWVARQADDKLMVSFTAFVGRAKKDKNGRTVWPKVVILIGRSGIAVQIPSPVIIGRVWEYLVVAKKINAKISPYDFSDSGRDDGAEYDNFNPPEDSVDVA